MIVETGKDNALRVLHCTSSMDASAGGKATCLAALLPAMASTVDTTVASLASASPVAMPAVSGLSTSYHAKDLPVWRGGSSSLLEYLQSTETDLFHIHGLWHPVAHHAVRIACHRDKPILVSPHGMLEPGALQFSRWRKRLAGMLYQKRDLRVADCVHCTSAAEADHVREFGVSRPVAVIPIGVNLNSFHLAPRLASPDRQRTVLFLSRLHPKKGLPSLLEAWHRLGAEADGWQLRIVGPDEGGHRSELEQLAQSFGIAASVSIEDPVYGEARLPILQHADLFVLPSRSENFGMVVAEALACGVPVITTDQTPWADLPENRCGWCVPTMPIDIHRSLVEAMALGDDERAAMGRAGRKLIEERYSVERTASELATVYEWLVNGGAAPSCVRPD